METAMEHFIRGDMFQTLKEVEYLSQSDIAESKLLKAKVMIELGNLPGATELLDQLATHTTNGQNDIYQIYQIKALILKSQIDVNNFLLREIPERISQVEYYLTSVSRDVPPDIQLAFDFEVLKGSYQYYSGKLQAAIQCFEQGLELSQKLDKYHQGYIYRKLGRVRGHLHEYRTCSEYLDKALQIFEEMGNELEIIKTIEIYGTNNYRQGKLNEALKYYFQVLEFYKNHPNQSSYSDILNSIGNCYLVKKEFPTALEFYEQSLAINQELKIPEEIACSYHNIGLVYKSIGQFQRALAFYNKALNIRETHGSPLQIASNLSIIANLLFDLGRLDEVQQLQFKALELRENVGNPRMISYSLSDIGKLYYIRNDHSKALEYYLRSLKISTSLNNKIDLSGILSRLVQLNISKGNQERAIYYFSELSSTCKDSDLEAVKVTHKLAEAQIIKLNHNMESQLKAKSIFEEVATDSFASIDQIILAKLNMCELLLYEYKALESTKLKNQIEEHLQDLYSLSSHEGLLLMQIRLKLISAKFKAITAEYEEANQLFDEIKIEAHDSGFQLLMEKIENEQALLMEKLQTYHSKSNQINSILNENQIEALEHDLRDLQIRPLNYQGTFLKLKNYQHLFNPSRLSIMDYLDINLKVHRVDLEKLLDLNPGSVKNHLDVLVKHKLISVEYDFINEKPRQVVYITSMGRFQYQEFKQILEKSVFKM